MTVYRTWVLCCDGCDVREEEEFEPDFIAGVHRVAYYDLDGTLQVCEWTSTDAGEYCHSCSSEVKK